MDRRERRELFERLLVFRSAYRLRGDYDARPAMPVEAAIAWAERLLGALNTPSARLATN